MDHIVSYWLVCVATNLLTGNSALHFIALIVNKYIGLMWQNKFDKKYYNFGSSYCNNISNVNVCL